MFCDAPRICVRAFTSTVVIDVVAGLAKDDVLGEMTYADR